MSIINHTFKFVFVHIPKCGGTTVSYALEPLCGYKDLQLGGTEFGELIHKAYIKRFGIAKHSLSADLRRILGNQTWTEYTSFAIIRDPIERSVSTFRYLKQHSNNYPQIKEISNFAEFIRSSYWKTDGPDRLFLPQHVWLFELAGQRRRLVDRLIDLSRIEIELPETLLECGIPKAIVKRVSINVYNQSYVEAYPEISDADKEILRERYRYDTPEYLQSLTLPR